MSRRLTPNVRSVSCPSCLRRPYPTRVFSTTPSSNVPTPQASTIPPESPRHSPVVGSLQATVPEKPRIRGILPTPRDILGRRDEAKNKKYSDDNVWRTLRSAVLKPLKDSEVSISGPESKSEASARDAWRKRHATQRRHNLVQGMIDLKLRQKKSQFYQRKKSAARWEERRALRAEREARQDELLTAPSTTQAMMLQKGRIPDPNREARIAEMQARVKAMESRKIADRKEALHTLYMNARDFIVSEEQLDAAIEKCFGSAESPRTFGNYGVSIWHHKRPDGIADKLARANRTRRTLEDAQGFAATAKTRIQKIAEELTGGKL